MLATLRRTHVLSLLLALAVALCPSPALAAAKKVTVNHAKLSYTQSVMSKRAKALKEGTYVLAFKKLGSDGKSGMPWCGFIKFKAPKTGTYTFTLSKGASKDPLVDDAHIAFWTKNTKKKKMMGQVTELYLGPQKHLRVNNSKSGVPGAKAKVKQRTKLKKGEWVYLQVAMSPGARATTAARQHRLANGSLTLTIG